MYKTIDSKQFHYMNATVETVVVDGSVTVKRLVSYTSIVCDVDLIGKSVYIYPRYQYSPTTIRQFTRFLNEYVPLTNGYWRIGLIRELMKQVDSDGYTTMDRYGVFFLDHVLGSVLGRRW